MLRNNPLTESETKTSVSKYSRGDWQIVECQETGMVFLQNPPAYDDLVDDFAWEKTFLAEKERRRNDEPIFSRLSDVSKKSRKLVQGIKKIERIPADYLKALPVDSRPRDVVMLDVGCGLAENTMIIAGQIRDRLGVEVSPIGIEISREQAKIAQERLSTMGNGYCIQNSAIEGLNSVDDQSVDVIVLCSFLEHEVQPLELLRVCRKKLKKHGAVVIKVPNFDSLNRKLRQNKWCGFRYPDHVNYFTPNTLRGIVERSGLRVGRMSFLDRFPFSDNMYIVACI